MDSFSGLQHFRSGQSIRTAAECEFHGPAGGRGRSKDIRLFAKNYVRVAHTGGVVRRPKGWEDCARGSLRSGQRRDGNSGYARNRIQSGFTEQSVPRGGNADVGSGQQTATRYESLQVLGTLSRRLERDHNLSTVDAHFRSGTRPRRLPTLSRPAYLGGDRIGLWLTASLCT